MRANFTLVERAAEQFVAVLLPADKALATAAALDVGDQKIF